MSAPSSKSVRVVAWIEIVTGALSAADILSALVLEHHLRLNFGVVGLWIGVGLLNYRESSRAWGVRWSTIGVILCVLAMPFFVFSPDHLPITVAGATVGSLSHWWVIALLAALGGLTAWELWVLQHPAVRALFVPAGELSAAGRT